MLTYTCNRRSRDVHVTLQERPQKHLIHQIASCNSRAVDPKIVWRTNEYEDNNKACNFSDDGTNGGYLEFFDAEEQPGDIKNSGNDPHAPDTSKQEPALRIGKHIDKIHNHNDRAR